jgi:TRAP-type C4-dicarboxylate transport system substrate-binding protein
MQKTRGSGSDESTDQPRYSDKLTRRQSLKTGAALAGGLALTGCIGDLGAGGGGEITLRVGLTVPEGATYGLFTQNFVSSVTEQDEDISFDVFYNSELGGPTELGEKTSSGDIDMAMTDPNAVMPDLSTGLKFPYIYEGDIEKLIRVTDAKNSPIMEEVNEKAAEETNVRDLGHSWIGHRQVEMIDTEVYEPADLKGKNIRGPDVPIYQTLARGLGANPTPVPPSEIVTALETGTIDGIQLPIATLIPFNLGDLLCCISETNHYLDHNPFIINLDTWEGLSDERQEIFETGVDEAVQQQLELTTSAEEDARDILNEKGVKFITPDEGLKIDEFEKSVTAAFNDRWPDLVEFAERIRNS